MVHTEADRYKRRAIIRQTWGQAVQYPNANIRLLFVMGNITTLPLLQKAIVHESETDKDILQEDFEESPMHATDKTIGALKWICKHCNNARYVLKTDDKMFINMFTVLHHLGLLHNAGRNQNVLMGLVWNQMHVQREGTFAIPKEVYPNDMYPPFCSNFAYFMSMDVVQTLHSTSYKVKYLRLEDVFVTGIVATAAGVNVIRMNQAFVARYEIEELFSQKTEWYKYGFAYIQDYDVDLFLRVWNKLIVVAKNNDIPSYGTVEPGKLADIYLPKEELVKNPEAPYNQKI